MYDACLILCVIYTLCYQSTLRIFYNPGTVRPPKPLVHVSSGLGELGRAYLVLTCIRHGTINACNIGRCSLT